MDKNLNIKSFTFAAMLLFAVTSFLFATEARAATTDKVSGFAWSENIGWISFNSENDHDPTALGRQISAIPYGVTINGATNVLSGYAWSDKDSGVGWISFNLSDTGAPPAEYNYSAQGYIAKYVVVDPSTGAGELRGWARAISVCPTLPCRTSDNAGGWDGWIKLQKHPSDAGGNYGALWDGATLHAVPWDSLINGKELKNWAWGSDVAGWVSFNCKNDHSTAPGVQSVCADSNYQVVTQINFPPSATNLSVVKENYCTIPAHRFSWSFSDPDNDTQTNYTLEASANSSFASPEIQISATTTATSKPLTVAVNPGPTQLAYNTTYFWRLKVFDSGGKDSGWLSGNPFTTEKHLYPDAKFMYNPLQPSKGEQVLFAEKAVCYTGNPPAQTQCPNAGLECPNGTVDKCYAWDFSGGAPPTAFGKTATTTYSDTMPHQVSFTITDKDSYTCTDSSTTIRPRVPLPKFKETAPISLMNHALKKT